MGEKKSDKDLNSWGILLLLYKYRFFDIIIIFLEIYFKEIIG